MYLFGLRPGKDAFYGGPGFLQVISMIYLIGGFVATWYYGRTGFVIFTGYILMGGVVGGSLVGWLIILKQNQR